MSKSQRIRQTFTENLLELRNPMIKGRKPINKKYLIQGKKNVQAAIKSGEKTGDPFSKTQLADIAQQSTDKPEIAAEKRGGGKKLPPELGPSDRQVATKKALMRQTDSTNHVGPFIKESNAARRAALRALRARHNLPGSNPTSAEIGHRAGRAVAAYQSPWTPAGSKGAKQGITDLAKKYGKKAKKDPQEFSQSSDELDKDADETYRGVERAEKGEPTSFTTGIKRGILTGRKILQGVRSRMQPQNSSTNYAREGLKALFENNYLRLHPVGKPGDQAIHNTLRAHFDSLDPKIGADLHKQLDRHIKMYHYVRETPGESGAHAELRRFEHGHLMDMAKTGSQGVTPKDVRQHFHMFNNNDPSDRLAHTAIKDSFYRPKESKNNIKAGLRALFEAILDEARGLGSQASKERQGKLERRFDALDKVARKQRGTTVSKGGVTYIGNRPVKTRGEEKVSKERARVALKLEPKVDDRDPNPDLA